MAENNSFEVTWIPEADVKTEVLNAKLKCYWDTLSSCTNYEDSF